MRDRLVELLLSVPSPEVIVGKREGKRYATAWHIADHLLANGVIVPPVKVGAIVYVLRSRTSNGKNMYLREERVDHYRIFGEHLVMCFESGRVSVTDYLWDSSIFLTREDAEQALKGGDGE